MDESHLTPVFKLILVVLILLFNIVYYILALMKKKQRRREAETLEGEEPAAPRQGPMEALEEILGDGEPEQGALIQADQEILVETRKNELIGIDEAAVRLLAEAAALRERIAAKKALMPLLRVIDEEIFPPLEALRGEVHAILGDPLSQEADILFTLRGQSTIVEKSFLLGVLREIALLREQKLFESSIRPSAVIAEAFMRRLRELLGPVFPRVEKLCAVAMPSKQYLSHPPEEKIAGAGILFYPAYDHPLPSPHGYALVPHFLCANLVRSCLSDEALSAVNLPRGLRMSAVMLGADYLCSRILGPSYLLAMAALAGGGFHGGRVDICLQAMPADADAGFSFLDVAVPMPDATPIPPELADRVLSMPLLSGLSLSSIGTGAFGAADRPGIRLAQKEILTSPSDLAGVDPLCLLAGGILAVAEKPASAQAAALALEQLLRGVQPPAARRAARHAAPPQAREAGGGAWQEDIVVAIMLGALLQRRDRPPFRQPKI